MDPAFGAQRPLFGWQAWSSLRTALLGYQVPGQRPVPARFPLPALLTSCSAFVCSSDFDFPGLCNVLMFLCIPLLIQ